MRTLTTWIILTLRYDFFYGSSREHYSARQMKRQRRSSDNLNAASRLTHWSGVVGRKPRSYSDWHRSFGAKTFGLGTY
jgi:hypothetical protein